MKNIILIILFSYLISCKKVGPSSNPVSPDETTPVVSYIEPAIGSTTGGTLLLINGSGFKSPTVSVGGVDCTSVSVTDESTITCVLGSSVASFADVIVKNSNGHLSNATSFLYSSSLVWLGSQQIGTTNHTTTANAVTSDSNNAVYVTGNTNGSLYGNKITGSQDMFVFKEDSTGAKLWASQLGVSGQTTAGNGITIDSSGNVYIVGSTTGSLPGVSLNGNSDAFVVKYNANGLRQWIVSLGVSGANTYGTAICLDSNGNIIIVGNTNGNLDSNTLTGSIDFFITQYAADSTRQWTKLLGASNASTYGKGVSADSSGNIFATGNTDGALPTATKLGTVDIFSTKYNGSGVNQYTSQYGATSNSSYATGIVSYSNGPHVISGYTDGNLYSAGLTGTIDAVVLYLDYLGGFQWVRQLGSAGVETKALSIALNPGSGTAYITGSTNGALPVNSLTGLSDFFLAKTQNSGNSGNGNNVFSVIKQLGATGGTSAGNGITVYNSNTDLVIVGGTDKGLDGNSLKGSSDGFLVGYDTNGNKRAEQH